MRLFVTEFITGGGIANDLLPDSLKQEGQLMLQAVLNECSKINGLELIITKDARIKLDPVGARVHVVENTVDYMQQLILLARQSDVTWVIAPESEGILESIIQHLTREQVTLLNCDQESVRICADKLACFHHLVANNIATVKCFSGEQIAMHEGAFMIKHRDGVGGEGLMQCQNAAEVRHYTGADSDQWVIQPYVNGEHLSISMICSDHDVRVITLNQQVFSGLKTPRLAACLVNAHPVNDAVRTIAIKLKTALPGLRGYVGVDLIQCNDEYFVVDINPRLTSSFAGLSAVLKSNPAELCINSVMNARVPEEIALNNKIIEVKVV